MLIRDYRKQEMTYDTFRPITRSGDPEPNYAAWLERHERRIAELTEQHAWLVDDDERACVICGESLRVGVNKQKNVCSEACLRERRRNTVAAFHQRHKGEVKPQFEKLCAICGNGFKTRNLSNRACSTGCRQSLAFQTRQSRKCGAMQAHRRSGEVPAMGCGGGEAVTSLSLPPGPPS